MEYFFNYSDDPINFTLMNAYSKEELQEFKELINKKLEIARREFQNLSDHLQDNSTKDTDPVWFNANYINETAAIEETGHHVIRIKKFIDALSAALIRIENGTYGICTKTGELIPKGRLMAVPHATLSINAKLDN